MRGAGEVDNMTQKLRQHEVLRKGAAEIWEIYFD